MRGPQLFSQNKFISIKVNFRFLLVSKFNPSWQYCGGYYWLAKWDLDECELSNRALPKVMLAVMIMRMLFLANNSLSMMMIGDDDCLPANMLI